VPPRRSLFESLAQNVVQPCTTVSVFFGDVAAGMCLGPDPEMRSTCDTIRNLSSGHPNNSSCLFRCGSTETWVRHRGVDIGARCDRKPGLGGLVGLVVAAGLLSAGGLDPFGPGFGHRDADARARHLASLPQDCAALTSQLIERSAPVACDRLKLIILTIESLNDTSLTCLLDTSFSRSVSAWPCRSPIFHRRRQRSRLASPPGMIARHLPSARSIVHSARSSSGPII
jgi:hypothetical protein